MADNLTFDDGEPLDVVKFQRLYQMVLNADAKANAQSSLLNQTLTLRPRTFASSTGSVTVSNKLSKVATIDYSPLILTAGTTPKISVTAKGSSDGIVNVKYFVKNVGSSTADLMAITTDKDGVKVEFDFIAVYMDPKQY